MNSWWTSIESVTGFNVWMGILTLVAAAAALISIGISWRKSRQTTRDLIDRERRAVKRIKAVEKAAEQIRKELLAAQQSQDILDQQRKLAEMDAGALRGEIQSLRKRYADAEGALKSRIKELKDLGSTQGAMQNSTATSETVDPTSQLDAQQVKMITKLLKTGPKGEVDILSVLDDPVSFQVASEIQAILDDQGWNTQDIVQSAFSQPPEGIVLVIHSKQTAPSYAKFLQRTLTSAGLPVSAQINNKFREWSLSILVGQFESA